MVENLQNTESQGDEGVIDLEQYSKLGKKPPQGKKYKVKVGEENFVFEEQIVTGRMILKTAGKLPVECHSLYQKLKDCDFEMVSLEESIDLSKPGIEHFIVKDPETFYYMVDEEPESTPERSLTPIQILTQAGLKASDYYLVQKNSDGTDTSYKNKPNESIIMRCPGLKFISIYNGETPVS